MRLFVRPCIVMPMGWGSVPFGNDCLFSNHSNVGLRGWGVPPLRTFLQLSFGKNPQTRVQGCGDYWRLSPESRTFDFLSETLLQGTCVWKNLKQFSIRVCCEWVFTLVVTIVVGTIPCTSDSSFFVRNVSETCLKQNRSQHRTGIPKGVQERAGFIVVC